jgi:glyoxylase-like metal-dependent hydrolase (beta-lactamase superfamily II)
MNGSPHPRCALRHAGRSRSTGSPHAARNPRLAPGPSRASGSGSASFVESLPHGIHVIDTGYVRPRFDAAYLVVENGRAAFVDTGTNHAVPRLLAALGHAGLGPDAVDWLIATHVHLDHAGGAGLLLRSLPNARLVVHPRGARHLIDPAALVAGASAVYGAAEVERSYGRIVGVDPKRVLETHDGMTLDLAGRALEFIDTPGHARHHHCIWDAASRGWFTGDTFGLSYRELDTAQGAAVLPATTPVQFDPAALHASIARLLERAPERMYVTHYGAIGAGAADVARLGRQLLEQVDAMVEIARELRGDPSCHDALKRGFAALYVERLRSHGCAIPEARLRELLAIDVELNAQGLGVWLDRQRASAP